MDPGLVLERTKRSKKRLFSAMLRYFSRNLSGSHQNNALSCEKPLAFCTFLCLFNKPYIIIKL